MCINDQVLSANVDGELREVQRYGIKDHLDICTACKKRVNALRAVSNQVKIDVLDIDQIVEENE